MEGRAGHVRALSRLFVFMTLAGGTAVTGLAAADVPALMAGSIGRATAVAERATCRTVDVAIIAYLADHGRAPTDIAQLAPYADGDISAYVIRDGRAAGPGCDPRDAQTPSTRR